MRDVGERKRRKKREREKNLLHTHNELELAQRLILSLKVGCFVHMTLHNNKFIYYFFLRLHMCITCGYSFKVKQVRIPNLHLSICKLRYFLERKKKFIGVFTAVYFLFCVNQNKVYYRNFAQDVW